MPSAFEAMTQGVIDSLRQAVLTQEVYYFITRTIIRRSSMILLILL